MAYKKLTTEQWIELEGEINNGASITEMSNKYGVSYSGIRKRLGIASSPKVLEVAQAIVESRESAEKAKKAVDSLVHPIQVRAAFNLADSLPRMMSSVFTSAELQAGNMLALSRITNMTLSKIDESNPDPDLLRMVHGLTETANKAAYQPLELIKANKEMMQNSQEKIDAPSIDPTKLSSEVRQQLLAARDATDRS